jgi:hypothetical protein
VDSIRLAYYLAALSIDCFILLTALLLLAPRIYCSTYTARFGYSYHLLGSLADDPGVARLRVSCLCRLARRTGTRDGALDALMDSRPSFVPHHLVYLPLLSLCIYLPRLHSVICFIMFFPVIICVFLYMDNIMQQLVFY